MSRGVRRRYGDLLVSTDAGERLFVLLMIFIGILAIATRLTTVVSIATKPIQQYMFRMIDKLHCGVDSGVDSEESVTLQSAVTWYTTRLLPSMCLNVALQLISALVFHLIEGWDFGTAVYHCIVTATTVGCTATAWSPCQMFI